MAVDCRDWYALPEVSPTEGCWWEKENARSFHDVRVQASLSSSTPSLQPSSSESTLSPLIPSTGTGRDSRHQAAADLSISSLHSATPNTSSVRTPSYGGRYTASELSSETVQSRTTKPRGVSDHRVKFVAHLEPVTEIDELWRRFQASSLVGKENSRCSCGAKTHSVKKREPRMKDSKSKVDSMKSSATPREKRSVLVERAIQTSPMLHPPRPLDRGLPHPHTRIPRSPSVAFSIASPSRPAARPRLGQLTLSEALALNHPEFIEASLRRQRELRERRYNHLEHKAYYGTGKGFRKPHSSKPATVRTYHPLKSVGVASPGWHLQLERPKMSKRDMYEASKRAWSQLPEVKARALAEKRRSQAETNRLRVKLYQKEVLSRLRQQSKQKH